MNKKLVKLMLKSKLLSKCNDWRWCVKYVKNNKEYEYKSRKEAFTYIYENSKWGKLNGEKYFSGQGSHNSKYINNYSDIISNFIIENKIKEVCDLGCGDFHVASKWISKEINYIGVDIVDSMVQMHNKNFGNRNIKFLSLDIVEDELPEASLCIIRQVLQHLSNSEIEKVLQKTKKYKFVIITEHVTNKKDAIRFNVDKEHGGHTRVQCQSGVYFDEAPYCLKIVPLLRVPYDGTRNNEELLTILIKNC